MPIVMTVKDRCRRCYACVRRCPAKAIRVRAGQAEVMLDRCVVCGRCVKVCTQGAKQVVSNLDTVQSLMADGNVIALLAPSFVASFFCWAPGQVLAALRRAGFSSIHEVAFGADLVALRMREQYDFEPSALVLTSPCPAANEYIQKFAPELVEHLAPILSPMAAMGRALKERFKPGCRTVFIGPCTAKINEVRDPSVSPWIDAVLTFPEVKQLLVSKGIDPSTLPEEEFDPPRSRFGGIFPVPRGLLRTAELDGDLLDNGVADVVGTDAFTDVVERLRNRIASDTLKNLETRFFDILFCRGCIDGPMMCGNESQLSRKERLASWMRSRRASFVLDDWRQAMDACADLDLSRTFAADNQRTNEPSEEEISRILAATGKVSAAQELNCGACGYRSCRDKARAVYNGLAELEMCLPYLVERLEDTVRSLNKSHAELSLAQNQLVRSERLASMGELAAGIAHEVNNPLGTILIYSHLLAEQVGCVPEGERERLQDDVNMIVEEAKRCKLIVGGLLDFARQTKVNRTPVVLEELLRECVTVVWAGRDDSVKCKIEVVGEIPPATVDRDQIFQVFVNVLRNAVEAMPNGGEVGVVASFNDARASHVVEVRDTGPGIAEQDMSRLFAPFFTTKPVGKGTGLGLPICYGIVKMHRGTIVARNNVPGPGATFEISLPWVDLNLQTLEPAE